jgi:methylated-DNA-protein-cysteine methyltransferase-like protein
MNNEKHQAILAVIKAIPAGCLATYGDVAKLAGLPRGHRLVARLLSQLPDDTLIPWHRVVNGQGKIALPVGGACYQRQRERLLQEGIILKGNKIEPRLFRQKRLANL